MVRVIVNANQPANQGPCNLSLTVIAPAYTQV